MSEESIASAALVLWRDKIIELAKRTTREVDATDVNGYADVIHLMDVMPGEPEETRRALVEAYNALGDMSERIKNAKKDWRNHPVRREIISMRARMARSHVMIPANLKGGRK